MMTTLCVLHGRRDAVHTNSFRIIAGKAASSVTTLDQVVVMVGALVEMAGTLVETVVTLEEMAGILV